MKHIQLKSESKKPLSKTRSRETKPGFQIKSKTALTTKTKALKRAKESKQNKTTVKQSLQRKIEWQFCFCGFAYLRSFSGVHSFLSFLFVVSAFTIDLNITLPIFFEMNVLFTF